MGESKHTPGPWTIDGGSTSLIWAKAHEGAQPTRSIAGSIAVALKGPREWLLIADLCPRGVADAPGIDERKANARLYAAVQQSGCPAINVYGYDRREVELRVRDRVANGEAFPGERVKTFDSRADYDRALLAWGLPPRMERR